METAIIITVIILFMIFWVWAITRDPPKDNLPERNPIDDFLP